MGREKKKALSVEKIYKYDISKSNTFVISAAFDYSLIEQKVVNYIIMKIQPDVIENTTNKDNNSDRDPLTYDIDFDELCKMSGMKICGMNYKQIQNAIESLMDKRINVKMPNLGTTGLHFLDRYIYFDNKGFASVKIDDRMIPLVLEFQNNFLRYNPKYTMLAKSKYTIRIYEWLKATMDKRHSGIKKRVLGITKDIDFVQMSHEEKKAYVKKYNEVDEQEYEIRIKMSVFRENLGIGTNIKGYKMLYNKILSKCMDEVNDQTDIFIKSISYSSDTDEIIFITGYKTAIERYALDQIIEEKINNVYLPKSNAEKNENTDSDI